jgi:hypothetical protein
MWPSLSDIKENVTNFYYEHEDTIKTVAKVTAAVAITAAVVVAAPVVAGAVATAATAVGVSTTVAAGVATVTTATLAGATVAGGTEFVNQAIDDGITNVDGKTVAIKAASGGLKAGITATLAVVGAPVVLATKVAVNGIVDVGTGYLTSKLNNKSYSVADAIDDAAVSSISTTIGWGAGKINSSISKGVNNWVDANRYNISSKSAAVLRNIFKSSVGVKDLQQAFKDLAPQNMVEYYQLELEDALQRYIVESAVNNDRNLLRKQILAKLHLSPSEIYQDIKAVTGTCVSE